MAKRAVVDTGQLRGMHACAWLYWPFLRRILPVVSQTCEINLGRQQQSQNGANLG